MLKLLSFLVCAVTSVYGDVFVSPHLHNTSSYASLSKDLSHLSTTSTLCFVHSKSGVDALAGASSHCTGGIVMYGAAPNRFQMSLFDAPVPILVIGGSRDGVLPMSQVTHSYHIYNFSLIETHLLHCDVDSSPCLGSTIAIAPLSSSFPALHTPLSWIPPSSCCSTLLTSTHSYPLPKYAHRLLSLYLTSSV